jgi:hypothetical protein
MLNREQNKSKGERVPETSPSEFMAKLAYFKPEDRAFIIKACNNYHELLADAKAAATAYETLSDEALDGAMTKLQATIAAIAKAEGSKQ